MHGPFGDCSPAIYFNGHFLGELRDIDIDSFATPDELMAIEVYSEASVPVQFRKPPSSASRSDAPCGSIVIWTR
jgi:hypothetical protein